MKMTKRIAAMAACAVMTVTSMVGMNASAGYSSTMLEPNGNPVSITMGGVNYGFQIRSEVRTGTSSSGYAQATATTYLYEVNGKSIPKNNLAMQTILYGKSKKTGQVVMIDGSYDILFNPNSSSSVYATVSRTDYENQYSSFAASGWARMRPTTYDDWTYVNGTDTSFIS